MPIQETWKNIMCPKHKPPNNLSTGFSCYSTLSIAFTCLENCRERRTWATTLPHFIRRIRPCQPQTEFIRPRPRLPRRQIQLPRERQTNQRRHILVFRGLKPVVHRGTGKENHNLPFLAGPNGKIHVGRVSTRDGTRGTCLYKSRLVRLMLFVFVINSIPTHGYSKSESRLYGQNTLRVLAFWRFWRLPPS